MEPQRPQRNLLPYTTVGMEFTVVFLLPTVAGIVLDARLDSAPGFTILGAACGFAVGLWHLLRRVRTLRQAKPPKDGDGRTT